MKPLFENPADRIYALTGNTADRFATPQLRLLTLPHWLQVSFQQRGYQRVVFYSPLKKIHFIDEQSARLAQVPVTDHATSTLPLQGQSQQQQAQAASSALSIKRPMGGLRLKAKPQQHANSTVSASQIAVNTETPQQPVRWDFGGMDDQQAASALDRLLTQHDSTLLVIQNAEDVFVNLDANALRYWDEMLASWLTRIPCDSKSMTILVFRGEPKIDARRLPRLAEHLFTITDDGITRPRPLRWHRVGPADAMEIKSLLDQQRLKKAIDWTPVQIKEQAFKLAQQMIPNDLASPIKTLPFLLHELKEKKYSSKMINSETGWRLLEQKIGMTERVTSKLRHLVDFAQQKLNSERENVTAKASDDHMQNDPLLIGRLTIKSELNTDNLANLHLALLGASGTGKTTVARIVGQVYREEGILPNGHVVEVSASQLIAGVVGQTAINTAEAISRAMGGVLFIDEAYGLLSNEFGAEAITELVQAMTTYNGQFAVIIAGYTKEINEFIIGPNANPGLARRFPVANRWELSNYRPDELQAIFISLMAKEGWAVDEELAALLPDAFSQWYNRQDPQRFGNAGEVINLVSELLKHAGGRKDKLVSKLDFVHLPGWRQYLGLHQLPSVDDILAPLNNMVGLRGVRQQLEDLYHTIVHEYRRNGHAANLVPGHYVFSGNPGTGKTVVAKLVANMLYQLGLLPSDHTEEVTAKKCTEEPHQLIRNMSAILDRAQNGVLFIDEAHQLVEEHNIAGKQVLTYLVPEMEDRRQQLSVILAGYPSQLDKMIAEDEGLASRTKVIHFNDYDAKELYEIAGIMLHQQGYGLSPEASDQLKRLMAFMYSYRQAGFGNARDVRNLIEKEILVKLARRLSLDPSADPNLIELSDIPCREGFSAQDWDDAVNGEASLDVDNVLKELNHLIGLSTVKEAVKQMIDTLAVQQRRKNNNPQVKLVPGHFVFTGNPGTGKTTVARMMGRIFRALGMLSKGHVVEVKREDLVAEYLGQTEPKTKGKILEAMDGILFIDEAYQLTNDPRDSYGKQAIETLLASMENERHRLCVIVAGYPNDMVKLLRSNPGFPSRFNHTVDFPNYDENELCEIAMQGFNAQGYVLAEAAQQLLQTYLHNWLEQQDPSSFGNARDVRNLVGKIIAQHNRRIRPLLDQLDDEQLNSITVEDLLKIEGGD